MNSAGAVSYTHLSLAANKVKGIRAAVCSEPFTAKMARVHNNCKMCIRDRVRMLYRADTCTNVFPSLHVFNTLSVCIAVHESEKLKKHKAVCNAAYILAALIILATMFLKQHSVLDVFGAVIMAYVLYKVVYEPEKKMIPQLSKQKFSKQKRICLLYTSRCV